MLIISGVMVVGEECVGASNVFVVIDSGASYYDRGDW